MFKKIVRVALLTGFFGGVAISLVQELTTTPLILAAEVYEAGGASETTHDGYAHSHVMEDLERFAFTALSNIVVAVGFAFLLAGCFMLYGKPVDGRTGVIWGLAGHAVFTLAPGLGLPPEVPGLFAAELAARQGWWMLASGATALGLWLMVFGRNRLWHGAGIIVILSPHLIGAPQADGMGGEVPSELAGHFVAASLVTAAIFWAMLGWLSGVLYGRSET